jgi:hypothetical protein
MVTWNERDDAREAFIAGSSGARKNTGTTKDTREAFTRGRTSAKEFRRRGQYKSPEDKRYTPGRKTAATKFTDKTGDIIRDAGGDFMDMVLPVFQKTMQGIGSIGANWKRNKQNREILEDAYTDEVHQAMVPNWNISKLDPGYEGSKRQFYDKYMDLYNLTGDPEKLQIANSAFQNAQITNRINYALGQPEYGFDTTAPTAQAAFGETPEQLKERIDYSALAGNLRGGLDATKEGRAFLANAYKKQADETGEGPIGDALWAYHPDMFNKTTEMGWENMAGSEPYNTWSDQGADPFYGGRSPIDELYAATTTMDPFVKGSSPVSRQYKDMWLANLIDEEDTPLGLI